MRSCPRFVMSSLPHSSSTSDRSLRDRRHRTYLAIGWRTATTRASLDITRLSTYMSYTRSKHCSTRLNDASEIDISEDLGRKASGRNEPRSLAGKAALASSRGSSISLARQYDTMSVNSVSLKQSFLLLVRNDTISFSFASRPRFPSNATYSRRAARLVTSR